MVDGVELGLSFKTVASIVEVDFEGIGQIGWGDAGPWAGGVQDFDPAYKFVHLGCGENPIGRAGTMGVGDDHGDLMVIRFGDGTEQRIWGALFVFLGSDPKFDHEAIYHLVCIFVFDVDVTNRVLAHQFFGEANLVLFGFGTLGIEFVG